MIKNQLFVFAAFVLLFTSCPLLSDTTNGDPNNGSNTNGGSQISLGPNTPQEVLTFAKPAVVLIVTDIAGTVTLPEVETDPVTGSLRPSITTYSTDYTQTYLGSGFIISPDGYIVTNAHVVRTDKDIEADLFEVATLTELQYAIDSYYYTYGYEMTDDQITSTYYILQDYINQNGRLDSPKRIVTVVMGANAAGAPPQQYTANVRKIGDSTIGGLDLSILKVDQSNLPTVKLGDSNAVDAASPVYAVGYPGIITEATGGGGVFQLSSVTEPTLTSGVITSRRVTNEGITVLGVDASIKGGNSGGPSFNEKGEVIGVNTFGFGADETYNFILPSNLLKDFLREANVVNSQGAVDEHYQKGLQYYWDGNYAQAKVELEIVKNLYPAHPYVGQYLTSVQERLVSTN